MAVFDEVQIVARVVPLRDVTYELRPADAEGIAFADVPNYLGPSQYLWKLAVVERAVGRAIQSSDAVILRVPSHLAFSTWVRLRASGKPYGVEVIGDPYDVFSPGAVRHPLRSVFRWWFHLHQQLQCGEATSAAYVTTEALQQRYPPAEGGFHTSYSDVELPEEAFVKRPRSVPPDKSSFTILSVASLAQLYKGVDVLLAAVASCLRKHVDVRLVVVGDGKHRLELELLASRLDFQRRVRFLGELPGGEAVRTEMDAADLFVLPSRTEGLPRAMIEAMARGMPCIGSAVGGIPELLPPEDLAPAGDASALADKICEVLRNPARMARMSARNIEKAREYVDEKQSERRIAFYRSVRRATEDWLCRRRRFSRSPNEYSY